MRVFKYCLMALMLGMSAVCGAEEFLVTQKDLKFSKPIQVVKPGDSILFRNIDNVTHNIVSNKEPTKFNFDAFQPGMEHLVKFQSVGIVDVLCTIHPKMKMTVFVWAR